MDTRKIIKSMLILFVLMFVLLSVYLMYIINTYGTRWFASPYNTRVKEMRETVTAGDILDRNGVVLAHTDSEGNRRYHESERMRMATALTVGDNYGQTIGAESFFASYLLGFNQDALEMVNDAISGRKRRGSDIRLTIDSQLCATAYDLLDGRGGAVVLMNYKTGEILASTSAPSFDPAFMKDYLSGDRDMADGALVNRAFVGQYTPGSVFKIVTTLAALRYVDNAEGLVFDCTGGLVFDYNSGRYLGTNAEVDVDSLAERYTVLTDYQRTEHGSLTLKEAFTRSCNNSYARLAMMVGSANLNKTAQSLFIGRDLLFSDMTAYAGKYDEPRRDVDLGWSGVGQYKDVMSPINLCMISAAIANDGVMLEPKLLRGASTSQGATTYSFAPHVYSNAMSKEEAAKLREFMISVVNSGTGTAAAISGYEIGGKTGTAEVTVNGENLSHAWFTGFIDSENHPLAVCVVVELGGSGGTVAAPIAGALFQKALSLGY